MIILVTVDSPQGATPQDGLRIQVYLGKFEARFEAVLGKETRE
jgi:hypothetical protein